MSSSKSQKTKLKNDNTNKDHDQKSVFLNFCSVFPTTPGPQLENTTSGHSDGLLRPKFSSSFMRCRVPPKPNPLADSKENH